MEMIIFLLWLFLSIAIGMWADTKERSALGWFAFSFLLTPLLAFLCLAVISFREKDKKPKYMQPSNYTSSHQLDNYIDASQALQEQLHELDVDELQRLQDEVNALKSKLEKYKTPNH